MILHFFTFIVISLVSVQSANFLEKSLQKFSLASFPYTPISISCNCLSWYIHIYRRIKIHRLNGCRYGVAEFSGEWPRLFIGGKNPKSPLSNMGSILGGPKVLSDHNCLYISIGDVREVNSHDGFDSFSLVSFETIIIFVENIHPGRIGIK